ncbi:MAG TPA: TonB-dependent receptor [Steroidobacteraceae bacterium]
MRNSLYLSLLRAAALGAMGSTAAAAAEESANAVVVTATFVPTPQEQLGSSMTVITADDIAARQQQTLPDVLRNVPGLNIVQTGGPGGTTSLFMRGTNTNHTKVLVDGIDVTDPSNAQAVFDFGQFLTQDIERVEILRGPQSGLYGSDAIGGVINIITRSGAGPAQLSGSAQAGSFATFDQSGNLSGSADQLHYSASLEHLHSGATPVTPLDLLLPGERRNDDYYDNLTASTKLGLDVTQDFDLGLVARHTETHLRYTGEDFSTFPGFPEAQQSASNTNEYYARVTAHQLAFDGRLEQTLGLGYTRDRTADFDPENSLSLDTGERIKVDWRGIVKLAATQTLVLGAEHEHDEISEPLAAAVAISSGYAEWQSQLTDRLYSAVNVRYDANDQFGGKGTFRLAPTYLIHETGTQLKASLGSGFKAPTLAELYQNFPAFFFFGNPNLRPETSLGYDLGVEQALGGELVRLGATYFHNRIRNLIDTAPTGTTYANVGRATTQGVESFLEYHPLKGLRVRVDYTYTEAIDDVLNEELLLRPKHKGSVDAAWQATESLSLDANLLSVGSYIDGNRDFSIPRLRAPGYTVVNLAGNYAVSTHLTLLARIDNLLDRHYENPIGFLKPGVGAFAGIKATL